MSWQPADSQNAVRTADQRAPGPAGSAVQEAGDARQVARAVVAGQRAGRGKESGPKMAENSDRGTTLPVVSRSRARLRNLNSAGLGELTCRRTHTMRKKKEKGEKKPKKKNFQKVRSGVRTCTWRNGKSDHPRAWNGVADLEGRSLDRIFLAVSGGNFDSASMRRLWRRGHLRKEE